METIDNSILGQVTGGAGLIHGAGEAVGFGAGVAVTGALGFVPGWNKQVPGQPEGFQKRHESVVGPQVASYANKLPDGAWKQFTTGVAEGATAAPGWSFRHGL
jgi:hypothetical protein